MPSPVTAQIDKAALAEAGIGLVCHCLNLGFLLCLPSLWGKVLGTVLPLPQQSIASAKLGRGFGSCAEEDLMTCLLRQLSIQHPSARCITSARLRACNGNVAIICGPSYVVSWKGETKKDFANSSGICCVGETVPCSTMRARSYAKLKSLLALY